MVVVVDCDLDVENENQGVRAKARLVVDLEVIAFVDPDFLRLLHSPFALVVGFEVFVASDDCTLGDFSLRFDVQAPFSVRVVISDRMKPCAQVLRNCDKQVDAQLPYLYQMQVAAQIVDAYVYNPILQDRNQPNSFYTILFLRDDVYTKDHDDKNLDHTKHNL